MKQRLLILLGVLVIVPILLACSLLNSFSNDNQDLESTRVALEIQQTSIAIEQTSKAQVEPTLAETEPPAQPTDVEPTAVILEQPTPIVAVTETETETPKTFEEWLKDVRILYYDDMFGSGQPMVIQDAIDGLRLARNTTNVHDAMGNLLSNLNSATDWDLVIIGAESRDNISGEYFDALDIQLDRGASIILEIWYIDDVTYGRIQTLMQRCGIAFQEDWQRDIDDNLNLYVVYLLDPEHPLFAEPNTISMLTPYGVIWYGDAGDFLKVKPDSEARLLGGILPKDASKFGLLAECLEGRMIWQTFSTHDYKTQAMTDLWQNYIMYTLNARYNYLQEE